MDRLTARLVTELSSPSAAVRLSAALNYSKSASGTEAMMLMCRNPRGDGFTVIANEGYPDAAADFFARHLEVRPEFARPLREGGLLSWEDTPEFCYSYSAQEILKPAGFNNGMTIPLRDERSRTKGILIMNMADRSFPLERKEPVGELQSLFTSFALDRYEQLARQLTPRELQVIWLMRDGMSNAEIGDHLELSPRTVATHVEGVFNKLGTRNRVAAVVEATRLGFFD